MNPDIVNELEHLVAKCKELYPNWFLRLREDIVDGTAEDNTYRLQRLLRLFIRKFPVTTHFQLNDQLKHIHNRHQYIQNMIVHNIDSTDIDIKLITELYGNICSADTMFLEFEKARTLSKQTELLQFYRSTVAQLDKLTNDPKLCCWPEIREVKRHFQYCERTFLAILKGPTNRLVNTYLGILPLKLDVWTVLFIVNQMPEFDSLIDAKKVRIYERMRLFKEEKLKPKVLVIRDKLDE